MKNIISIDWEDWFHICEVEHILPRGQWDTYPSILDEATDAILELLARKKARATFFILGYSAKRQPELVQRIVAAGHEIAHHTMEHQLVYEISPAEFSKDLQQGKKLLEELSNKPVLGFRAPQWSVNRKTPWAMDALIKAGFAYDSSRTPLPIIGSMDFPECVHVIQGEQVDGSLVEFPPLVLKLPGLKVPGGGGWGLKTWPIKWLLGKVKKLNKLGSPATFFLHPVDFVRHDHAKGLPALKKAVISFGLRKMQTTLDRLFDELQLTAMDEVLPGIQADEEK